MSVERVLRKSDLKVAHSVADVLRARILAGDLVPGQRLIEADILAEIPVGRSALREAFVQLDAEGFVELRHQRGAAVMRLTRAEMAEVFALRERLEGFAAFLAAERINDRPENRAWLLDQQRLWTQPEMVSNAQIHIAQNKAFHDGLLAMGGNRRLAETLERLQMPAYRQKFFQQFTEQRRRESAADHLVIIEAILAGDPHRAEIAGRAHVSRVAAQAQEIEGLG